MSKLFVSASLAALCAVSFSAAAADRIAAGKAATEKYNCASCHGKDYNSPIDPSYPKLAGQHVDYLQHSLMSYQRGGDKLNGRNNAIMAAQAKALSKEDIRNISEYIHSLPGTLVLRK